MKKIPKKREMSLLDSCHAHMCFLNIIGKLCKEQGARSKEQGARSKEQGARASSVLKSASLRILRLGVLPMAKLLYNIETAASMPPKKAILRGM